MPSRMNTMIGLANAALRKPKCSAFNLSIEHWKGTTSVMNHCRLNDINKESEQTRKFINKVHGVETTFQQKPAASFSDDPDESFSDVIVTDPSRKTKRYCLIKELKKNDKFQSILAVERHGPTFDRLVFVKRMHVSCEESDMISLKQAFLSEARTMAALSHPQIPKILNVQQKDKKVSIVMEYVNGQTFESLVSDLSRTGDFLPVPIACGLVEQLCGAIHFVHNAGDFTGENPGVIHRNIDLKNLMVDSNGYVKLIDLGIVKNYLQGKKQHQPILGETSIWKAPELISKGGYDHRVDIYSLGLVLYSLLVGKNPVEEIHDTSRLEEIINPAHMLSITGSILFDELYQIIATATHPDPRQRYQTADQFRKAIVKVANKHGELATPGEIRTYLSGRFHNQITETHRLEQAVLLKGRAKLEAKENLKNHKKRKQPLADTVRKAIRNSLVSLNRILSRAKDLSPSNAMALVGFLFFCCAVLGLRFFYNPTAFASSSDLPPETSVSSTRATNHSIVVETKNRSFSRDSLLQHFPGASLEETQSKKSSRSVSESLKRSCSKHNKTKKTPDSKRPYQRKRNLKSN